MHGELIFAQNGHMRSLPSSTERTYKLACDATSYHSADILNYSVPPDITVCSSESSKENSNKCKMTLIYTI